MQVHFQENLIWRKKGSVDKIGSIGIIFVHHQCMMIDCLGGGTE
jgi:hypothetical protein